MKEVIRLAASCENIDVPALPKINQPVNELAWPSGETPLMLAALMGDLKIFEWLIRHGANYSAKDADDFPVFLYCSDSPFAQDKRALYFKYAVGLEHPKSHYAREVMVDLLDHPVRMQMMVSTVSDSGCPGIFLGKEGPKSKNNLPYLYLLLGLINDLNFSQ